jgi:RNA polymerase sigma-70 factor (ECF subfamily)
MERSRHTDGAIRNHLPRPPVDRVHALAQSGAVTLSRDREDELIERARGDADAFGELYDRYFGQIYRFAYSRLHNRELAEEVTQEVFMKALRAMPRYRTSGHPFSAWLYQISANAIADHFRQRRTPTSSLDDAVQVADPEVGVADRVVRSAEAARVWAAIDSLPEQQRMAMTLKLGEDLRLAQIGAIMGKSEGAVKLLIHRGMAGVRQRLGVVVPAEEPG